MIRVSVFSLLLIFGFSCKKRVLKMYYPDGSIERVSVIQENIDSVCEEFYFDNEILELKYCTVGGLKEGSYIENYKSGNKYFEVNYFTGLKEGIGTFYYENGKHKATNLFYKDSLYYIKAISHDGIESENIVPITTLLDKEKENPDELKIAIRIPRTEEFPYLKDTLHIYYTLIEVSEPDTIFSLPENKLSLINCCDTIRIKDNFNGSYKLAGLVTINNQVLSEDNPNFFQLDFTR